MGTRDTVCAMAADASAATLTLPDEPTWRLARPYYQLALEHDAESRLAICNGVLGVRASLEQPTSASRPRTFVAGPSTHQVTQLGSVQTLMLLVKLLLEASDDTSWLAILMDDKVSVAPTVSDTPAARKVTTTSEALDPARRRNA